jgi:putative alpha-1,2-mannosidase
MSSWLVWAALGMYPEIPGRAELVLGSPLFPKAVIHRKGGDVVIEAPDVNDANLYVQSLTLDGKPLDKPWLPASFAGHGGHLRFTLGAQPDTHWGSDPDDVPPSFPPPSKSN